MAGWARHNLPQPHEDGRQASPRCRPEARGGGRGVGRPRGAWRPERLRRRATAARQPHASHHRPPRSPRATIRPPWREAQAYVGRSRSATPEGVVSRARSASGGWTANTAPTEFSAPSAGLEPAHPAPEADALSAELRGPAVLLTGRRRPASDHRGTVPGRPAASVGRSQVSTRCWAPAIAPRRSSRHPRRDHGCPPPHRRGREQRARIAGSFGRACCRPPGTPRSA